MFSNNFDLEEAVLRGDKTMTRRYNDNYNIGDIVAIAMSYSHIHEIMAYDFDYKNWFRDEAGWFNKMFVKAAYMPYRIVVTGKWAERLQDITEEECIREGVFMNYLHLGDADHYTVSDAGKKQYFPTAREAFAYMIDKLNGRGTWKRNPRVHVYEFELMK